MTNNNTTTKAEGPGESRARVGAPHPAAATPAPPRVRSMVAVLSQAATTAAGKREAQARRG
jgi:hypothetical protein